ncbi:hypothetical protein H7X69_02685 [Candidatus Saccharibacteria bacterium]|nr:hypothetical protein [Candidatus Saccharibacteria bacterium]
MSVWRYQPSSAVASIYDRSGMSDKGKFYFYTGSPVVISAAEFNTSCQKQEEKSAILGCFSMGRIYIRDITNNQLDGIEEVTAAHETLHAVWDRMSESERKSIGELLEVEYKKINNPSLTERMAYYDRNEPGEHFNELHSIIGTEFADIDSKLEAYYSKYFSNRNKVVALHGGYQQLFDSVQAKADTLLAELNTLAADLKSSIEQYNNNVADINTQSNHLKDSFNSIDRTSTAEVNRFNTTRQALVLRINQIETLRSTVNLKSETYNTKLTQYNQLVIQSNELTQSLDGTLVPPPSI